MSENNSVDHSDRAHYVNGGSQITRRAACPGSLKMESQFPDDDKVSPSAIKGTRVHECIELALPHAFKDYESILEDRVHVFDLLKPSEKKQYEWDEWDAAHLAVLDIFRILGDKIPSVGWVAEKKFILDDALELGGTADFSYGYMQGDEKVGGIWDYKNGVTPVDANKTLQLALYACSMQKVLGAKNPFSIIHTHIFQPNSLNQNETVTSKSYTREELEELTERFETIAKRAMIVDPFTDKDLKLSAGDHCKFCKALAVCPEHNDFIHKKAIDVLDIHDEKQKSKGLPILQVSEKPDPIDIIRTLDDEKLVSMLEHEQYVKKAFKSLHEHLIYRARSGNPVEGTKCIEGATRRAYDKDQTVQAVGKFLKSKGVEKPWQKKLIPLTMAESLLKKSGLTAKQAKEVLEEVCTRNTPSISVVLDTEDDKRPAVTFNSVEEVSAILDAADSTE